MKLIKYLGKQPKWMLITMALIIICIPVFLIVEIKVENELTPLEALNSMSFKQTSKTIDRAVTAYIGITGDKELFFEAKEPVKDVETLLTNLQKKIKYKGIEYGPYLEPGENNEPDNSNYLRPLPGDKKYGWRIIIVKETWNVDVAMDAGNSIVFVDKDADVSKLREVQTPDWEEIQNSQRGKLESAQQYVTVATFPLLGVLILMGLLIVYNYAEKISVLGFLGYLITNFIAQITTGFINMFLFLILFALFNGILFFLVWLTVEIILLFNINKVLFREFIKEKDCFEFRILMAVFTSLSGSIVLMFV